MYWPLDTNVSLMGPNEPKELPTPAHMNINTLFEVCLKKTKSNINFVPTFILWELNYFHDSVGQTFNPIFLKVHRIVLKLFVCYQSILAWILSILNKWLKYFIKEKFKKIKLKVFMTQFKMSSRKNQAVLTEFISQSKNSSVQLTV